jgi:GntR family transcriptional repressor for pyruvate dehydrogenase complex
MEIRPVKTRRIYEAVVEQIKMFIATGEIKAGDKLPSERDLAESLQVSRASVREALSALEMTGLLETRGGERTFAKEVNLDSVVTTLAWMVFMEKDLVLELLEVRKILETQAVALAAQRRDEDDIKEIRVILSQMQDALTLGELGDAQDYQFHYALTKAAKNKILLRLMNAISDTMKQTLTASRIKLFESAGIPEHLLQEHRDICAAVETGDSEKARRLMLEHLEEVEKQYTI